MAVTTNNLRAFSKATYVDNTSGEISAKDLRDGVNLIADVVDTHMPSAGAEASAELAQASAELAQAWAESPTPPYPLDPDSKSAKTWAGEAAASAASAALFDSISFDNVVALLADTTLTYTAAQLGTVTAGDYVQTRAEGFAYQVAASDATDHHVTTAGGVKLYALPIVESLFCAASYDGTETEKRSNAYSKMAATGGGVILNGVAPSAIGSTGEPDDFVQALSVNSSKAQLMRFQVGTPASPDINSIDPALVVQKFTKLDVDGDSYSHQAGGVLGEVVVYGSGVAGGSTSDVESTWIAGVFNTHVQNQNLGTAALPDLDFDGNVVGLFGAASTQKAPGLNKIITALWGYATGPTLDATELSNSPAFSVCGLEINLKSRMPQVGARDIVTGSGNLIGQYMFNYRTPGDGVRDWTFGVVFAGNPDDDNFVSTDIANWNGFHTGILLDKIKKRGILFGDYFDPNSYGIEFKSSYNSLLRPKAGIFMGDTVLNMGQYLGSAFNAGDLWNNGGRVFYRSSDGNVTETLLASRGVGTSASFTANRKIHVRIGGVSYYLLASTTA